MPVPRDNLLPFDGYVTKIESGRLARAADLVVRLTYLDDEKGLFQGQVESATKSQEPYLVKIEAADKSCSCTCTDFKRRAQPCKHLAAFASLCRTATNGISPGQLASKSDAENKA